MSSSLTYIEHIKRAGAGDVESINYLENTIYEDIIPTITQNIDNLLLLSQTNPNNQYALCDIGDYYKSINNIPLMKEYYEKAIALGNAPAMNNLASHFQDIKDYDNMLKYYLMAIEKGFSYAMVNLGTYYKEIKDYDRMLQYYMMAYHQNNSYAIANLISYYLEIQDFEKVDSYYFELSMQDPILFQKYTTMLKNSLAKITK